MSRLTRYCVVVGVLIAYHGGELVGGQREKVEYVRLPLLTIESTETTTETEKVTTRRTFQGYGGAQEPGQFRSAAGPLVGNEGRREPVQFRSTGGPVVGNGQSNVDSLTELLDKLTGVSGEGDEGNVESLEKDLNEEEEGELTEGEEDVDEEGDGGTFDELDLIELVEGLEEQAEVDAKTGVFPEILDAIHGKKGGGATHNGDGISNITMYKSGVISRTNGSLRISLNEEGDLQLGSEDLSQFSDEIVEGISAGVEESLRMFDDDSGIDLTAEGPVGNATAETRQFNVYLFQGQYYAEPRLNRFIDGALQNMGTELRVSSMDPLYFRVLPKGVVAERDQPIVAAAGAIRRRRPGGGGGGGLGRRRRQAFYRPTKKPVTVIRVAKPGNQRGTKNRLAAGFTRIKNYGGNTLLLARKRQQQKLQQQRKRRQRLRQQRLKQKLKNNLKKKQNQQNRNKNKNKKVNLNKKQQQQLLNRIRRRIRQDVGGGRIEGLSFVCRDGDAEMQLFGNYTLIRSHMKMGPIELTMQFRTKNGIRRSGATLPSIRAHTVTRVNHEGSEMIDYLLDRPHPESIHVRGNLFPLAQRVARNIFARLFLPNSFLTTKLKEKAALAFLSRPVVG